MDIKNHSGITLAVDYIPAQTTTSNLIFCCTPVVPVVEFRKCYQIFADAGYNVYALDFAGVGDSSGDIRNLSIESICRDFESVIDYIGTQNQVPIYLFGDTGIGGLIAQYYAAASKRLRGFAQFGCVLYKDASPLKMPKPILTLTYPIVSLFSIIVPGMKMKSSLPAYAGYHADMDNAFYERIMQRYPHFLEMPIQLVKVILDILCSKDSPIQKGPQIPTLVFKTLHDRYFPASYFDRYYESLSCRKKLIEIDDVHNSYYFYPEMFAGHVIEWFSEISQPS